MKEVDPLGDRAAIATMRQYIRGGSRGRRYLALFILGLNTAFRAGSLLAPDVVDVRLPGGRIRASLEIREGKTAKSRRTPLSDAARQAPAGHLRPRPGARPDEPLFLSGRGGRLYNRAEHGLLSRAGRAAAGLERRGAHSLRKTFWLMAFLDTGEDLAVVQKLLNHASPGVTLRYIGHHPEGDGRRRPEA
jgi:integrase